MRLHGAGRRRLVALAAALLAWSSAAQAVPDVPTTERRALEAADLASGSGLTLPLDNASLPFGGPAYVTAHRALAAVGFVDPVGEQLAAQSRAAEDGKLHLESLAPSLSLRAYQFGGAEERLLEHAGGDVLRRGFNAFFSVSGSAGWGQQVAGAYELQLSSHPGDFDYLTKRLYVKGTLGKWSLKIGRDTVRLGPGYHGSLLLDDNAQPFDLWQVRTEEPLFLPGSLAAVGGFRLMLFNAYLSDSNPSPPDSRYGTGEAATEDPRLLGMRFSYHPASWLDLGVSRSILYGGEGRETYDTPKDWWELFTGTHENPHEGESDRYDNEQLAALDFTVRFPFLNGLGPLKTGKFYWEYGGTDFKANWKSDKGTRSWVPVKLSQTANIWGGQLTTGVTDLRVEYARIPYTSWYRHHQYAQGYSYRGLPLGHAVGGDARDLFVEVSRYFGPEWRLTTSIDLEERGNSLPDTEKRAEWRLSLQGFRLKAFGVPLTAGLDALGAYVDHPLDDPGTDDRWEWYVGAGVHARR